MKNQMTMRNWNGLNAVFAVTNGQEYWVQITMLTFTDVASTESSGPATVEMMS
jgi:hypothetical protein